MTGEPQPGDEVKQTRSLRAQLRPILAVAIFTALPSLLALHLLYAALDTRYQRFWAITEKDGWWNKRQDAPSPPQDAAKEGSELARRAGQLIMAGFEGVSLQSRQLKPLGDAIERGLAGGVILFERNVSLPQQLQALTQSLQNAAARGGNPPLLIAADQEGGEVQRLHRGNGHQSFPYSAKDMAQRCTASQAQKLYRAMACGLRQAGLTVNLGPVADVDIAGSANPIIGARERSFGPAADQVAQFGRAFIDAHHNAGIATAIKHFPGHGSSLTDSHKGFTDITESFSQTEFEPFRALAPVSDMVMVGHLHLAPYAEKNEPATFSRKLIEGVLRGEMGFDGAVISDDLEMDAIRESYSRHEAVIRAINAGVDIVLLGEDKTGNLAGAINAVITDAVRQECQPGSRAVCIPMARLNEAYERVIRMKQRMASRSAVSSCEAPPLEALAESICKGETQSSFWRRWLFW